MINELYNLSKTLDSNGITVNEWHRKYKPLPNVTTKSPCVRVWLDNNGKVCGLESLPSELVSSLRKYGDNQGSFPAFNINSLYRVTDDSVIKELNELRKGNSKLDQNVLHSWCESNNWIKGTSEQISRSMNNCAQELVELCKLKNQEDIITKLAELCKKGGNFRASLEKCVFDKLEKQEDITLMLLLLFHAGSASKDHSNDTGPRISIILDVYDWETYGHTVASKETTDRLNNLLVNENRTDIDATTAQQNDAFGTPFCNPNVPMPSVKLTGFEATLRSMFDGQPCQYRYGKINDESYPIAIKNRSSIKNALEWLARPSNQQITWVKLDKNEIAFIYPSRLPDVPLKFASLFARDQSIHPNQAGSRFEAVAKAFATAFQGIPPDQKPDKIQIFTIRKIDKARSKVIFTHNSSPEQLVKSSKDWSAGCGNLPALDLEAPDTPFPLDVPDILNAVWKQDGNRADGKTPVKRMKYYQGVELLLDALSLGAVQYYLHFAIENSVGLFMCLGNLMYSKKNPDGKSEYKKLEDKKAAAAQSLSVIGLLLYKCNERKENYMKELAFLLGQWLHVSDELHTLYCIVKRNGDIPPQLAGNALLVSTGEMAFQSLAQLYSRMNPFVSWAKQYRHQNINSPGEESWRAGWLLNLYEMFANQIMPQMSKTVRFGDFEKAELYIGYMASLPKRETPAKTDEHITGGIENE